MKTGYFLCK